MKQKISTAVFLAILISQSVLIEGAFRLPKIVVSDSAGSEIKSLRNNRKFPLETEAAADRQSKPSESQVSKYFRRFPSICSSHAKLGLESRTQKKSSTTVSTAKQPSIISLPTVDMFSSSWTVITTVNDQIRRATNDLLDFMEIEAQTETSSSVNLLNDVDNIGETIIFTEITDITVLAIFEQFITENVPFPLVLETLAHIWSKVNTLNHRIIFEKVMRWAILIVSRDYPGNYYSLIELIISNNIQFPSYQKAVLKASIMSSDQVQLIVNHLLAEFLETNQFGDFIFYGKFNFYFLEIANNYPGFERLPFIDKIMLPSSIQSTPILELIYHSTPLLGIFSHMDPLFGPDQVVSIAAVMANHCIATKLSPLTLAEQYEIILNLNKNRFSELDDAHKVVLIEALAGSLEAILLETNKYPEIPRQKAYALLVLGGYQELLLLFIRHLKPIFKIGEFNYIVNNADILGPGEPFGTLLTLLGAITVPDSALYYRDLYSRRRSLRLKMYIEVIFSIQEQNLAYNFDSKCDSHGKSLRSIGRLKTISWIIPPALNSNNYETISTADLLFIPLLFIQRVFNRDYRQSKVIRKYLRFGKPNYHLFPKIINDLLEDQYFGSSNQYPIVEMIIS